jgi:hypothetical protein
MKNALQQLVQQTAESKAQTQADVAQQAQRGHRQERTRYTQAAVLLIVLVVSLVLAIPHWGHPFAPPVGEVADQHARRALLFASSLVDAYQKRTGALPGTLSQVGVALPGIDYEHIGDTYSLATSVEGRTISLNRGDDPTQFLHAR